MVDQVGFEPTSCANLAWTGYKSAALPLSYWSLDTPLRFEPRIFGFAIHCIAVLLRGETGTSGRIDEIHPCISPYGHECPILFQTRLSNLHLIVSKTIALIPIKLQMHFFIGAPSRNWTYNVLGKSRMLCQLSYGCFKIGSECGIDENHPWFSFFEYSKFVPDKFVEPTEAFLPLQFSRPVH